MTRGDDELGRWETPIKGPGRYQLEFANVDDRVSLVVNGRPVGGEGIEFETEGIGPDSDRGRPGAGGHRRPQCLGRRERPCPEARYLLYPIPGPARLWSGVGGSLPSDADRAVRFPRPIRPGSRVSPMSGLTSTRSGRIGTSCWGTTARAARIAAAGDRRTSAWGTHSDRKPWEVPRAALTGKAFYVYWPHGLSDRARYRVSTPDFRLLFRPYVERMKWIR